jgi:hypothetical protein
MWDFGQIVRNPKFDSPLSARDRSLRVQGKGCLLREKKLRLFITKIKGTDDRDKRTIITWHFPHEPSRLRVQDQGRLG